jgi:four helix bundle protein
LEVVTNCDHLARLKFSPVLPHAFTEHGAIMAATVVNSPQAVAMSVYVVRAFIRMRERQQAMMLRTRRFALSVIRIYSSLARSTVNQVLGRQVLRSGTSVGAHYREACRAKSNADFVSKVEGALQELDETVYWLELLQESNAAENVKLEPLVAEANELISIFVTVSKSVKSLPATK